MEYELTFQLVWAGLFGLSAGYRLGRLRIDSTERVRRPGWETPAALFLLFSPIIALAYYTDVLSG